MYTFIKKLSFSVSVIASTLVVLMSSCADHDFDWDEARSANQEYNYNYNFEQLYGSIDSYQNWDFSEGTQLAGTRAEITSVSVQRVPGLQYSFNNDRSTVTGNTANDNNTLYAKIQNTLKDGEKHQGEAAVLVAPSNGFWLYPITAQGAYTYKLYVKIGNDDPIEVFSKGWDKYDKPYCNGMKIGNVSQCNSCNGTGMTSGICSDCNEGHLNCETCNGTGKVDVSSTDNDVYVIRNNYYTEYYLSNNSISKTGVKYKIVQNSNGKDVLYSIDDKKYLKINNKSVAFTDIISEASILDRTNGCLKLGDKYLAAQKGWNLLGEPKLEIKSKYDSSWGEDRVNLWTFVPATSTTTSQTNCTACNGTGVGATCISCSGTGHSEKEYCTTCKGSGYSNVAQMPGLYIEAPVGTPINVYIHVNDKNLGTSTGNAIVVTNVDTKIEDLDKRLGLKDEYVVNFIGIEDNENYGDKDYNDLTILLIGKPYVPGKAKIEENFIYPATEVQKRYMVEDMGYSDGGTNADDASLAVKNGYTDIDFNDIVIDFKRTTTHKYKVTTRDGVTTTSSTDETGYPRVVTTATVRALGGTWDFILYVGDNANGWFPIFSKGDTQTYPVTFNENYPTWANDPDISGFVVGEIYNTGNEFPRNDGQYNLTGDGSWLCTLNSPNVSKWNPATNNIRFALIDNDPNYGPGVKGDLDSKNDPGITTTVDGTSMTGKNVYTFGFPKAGAIPKIVAFPTTKAWKRERVPCRRDFFTGYAN